MVDQKLIERIKKRERNAFRILYEDSIAYSYSIVRRYVANSDHHADVLQDIYARVFLKIDTYDERKGEFKFWLRRLVINQSLAHYRAIKKDAAVVDIDNIHESEIENSDTLQGMTSEEIETCLQNMPDGYKQVFMLVSIDEYSQQEVSKMLGLNIQTVRSQLSRAKGWLRKNQASFLKLKNIR